MHKIKCMHVCLVTQSCSTLCDPMDWHVFWARILKWVAISSPGDLPNPGIELMSPASPAAWQADSLPLSYRGSPQSKMHPHRNGSGWNWAKRAQGPPPRVSTHFVTCDLVQLSFCRRETLYLERRTDQPKVPKLTSERVKTCREANEIKDEKVFYKL